MKKIFSFVVLAALVFGMASCEKDNGIPLTSDNAVMLDFTATGLDDGSGNIQKCWRVFAICGDYEVELYSGSTEKVAGTYDASQLPNSVVIGDKAHYFKSGKVKVTGEKPAYEISGYLIDEENVRFNLNLKINDYRD